MEMKQQTPTSNDTPFPVASPTPGTPASGRGARGAVLCVQSAVKIPRTARATSIDIQSKLDADCTRVSDVSGRSQSHT